MIYLPYRFISVTGPDAEKFLQGQVSCDIAKISEAEASFGTVNTPKGRMYGLFLIIRIENGFLLRLHESTADHFFESLSKYKVFFKCDMHCSDEWHALGHFDQSEEHLPFAVDRSNERISIRLPGSATSYEHWKLGSCQTQADTAALEKWNCAQSLNGIPELYAETLDQFILQHLNLQHLNAVSFNKGCYTGQEIIARMKFLGKLKKKTFLLSAEQKMVSSPGQSIFDHEGKKCGVLVRSHWHSDHNSVALGILDLGYIDNPKPVYLDEDACVAFSVSELVYN